MQPLRPQGHLAPPRLTTMWPISPGGAAAEPRLAVEDRGRRRRRFPRRRRSGSGTRARRRGGTRPRSRPGRRCRSGPRSRAPRFRAFSPSGKLPVPAGQVAGAGDDAGLLVGVAGGADPDAAQLARSRPRPARPPRAAPPPSPRRRPPGRRSVGVGRRASPSTSPSASTIAGLDLGPAEVDAAAQLLVAGLTGSLSRLRGSGKLERGRLARMAHLVGEAALVRAQPAAAGAAAGSTATPPRGGFFIRHPVEGEVLEALDEGRLEIGEGTLLEPGCWLTLWRRRRGSRSARAASSTATRCSPRYERIEIGDHVMFANGCFVGDADHRYDDPDQADHLAGLHPQGPGADRRPTAGSASTASSPAASRSASAA